MLITDTVKKFIDIFPLRELLSYTWVGIVGVGLDVLFFAIFRNQLNLLPVVSTILSASIAALLTFPLNLKFTFKKSDNLKKRLQMYMAINGFGVLLGATIMYLGYNMLDFDSSIVKGISVFIVAGTQFMLNKFIAFK